MLRRPGEEKKAEIVLDPVADEVLGGDPVLGRDCPIDVIDEKQGVGAEERKCFRHGFRR